MCRRPAIGISLLAWGFAAAVWSVLPAVAQPISQHLTAEETRAEFEAVCRRFRSGEDPYFGHQIIADLEGRIEASTDDVLVGVLLRGRLGHELIRLGRHEEALERLGEARRRLAADPTLAADPALALELRRLEGIAHLQVAEDRNCLENHAATSCILPIRPDAVHRLPDHARQAARAYLDILSVVPDNVQARWLLNLAQMLAGEYPKAVPERFRLPSGTIPSAAEPPPWREVGHRLGLGGADLSGGAIMDDFDGDGRLDLVSSSWDPCEPMKAYRNRGDGTFEDVAAAWGLDAQWGGLNLTHGDFDGDGRLDILVLRGAWLGEAGRIRNSLLRNDLDGESGRFVDVTATAGMAYPAYPTQNAAWGDYDLDGDVDIFVGNEATGYAEDPLSIYGRTGNPYPSQLFRNDGDATFTEVGRQAGVQNRRFAKGSAWGDFDDDGDPDLYVSNIGPNRLYRNDGDGTFTDVAVELGVDEPAEGTFPTWFFDFDNDGDLDLFVARYSTPVPLVSGAYFGLGATDGHPVLYRNDGGRFTDISASVGLTRPLLVMGANYGDLDNDGFPDVYLGTGVPDFDALMPNVMYRNDAGRRFEDVTFSGGFGHLQKGHGVAFGDIDDDGEQELFQQLGGAYPFDKYPNALYENPGSHNRWLQLRLRAAGDNSHAVGARIEVRTVTGDGERGSIHGLVGAGGSFGASSLRHEIGLGLAERIEVLIVRWPTGAVERFEEVEPDRAYEVIEGEGRLRPVALRPFDLRAGATDTTHQHQP
ncbi:MAG: CRTAC1 family protein [Thermoanaerobaculia bacterium]|nr:CRTAC1 family protein [Thermoanaerobaculia bacterium]